MLKVCWASIPKSNICGQSSQIPTHAMLSVRQLRPASSILRPDCGQTPIPQATGHRPASLASANMQRNWLNWCQRPKPAVCAPILSVWGDRATGAQVGLVRTHQGKWG